MYLKSIEVQGFKSFANKMTFEFHEGITGIVGPNGSGKSNVADAVRWVLGEQRIKQLRGASMQDVIFSGTENRKPLSYAYVAITLDNSDHQLAVDFEEVTVARRIYRSGESEYLLNGTACRLKDVNELFYDTGIGKEGYSIIGQGQIDRILSSKPEEARELFDEATGIVKFKRRKKTAQKKLEDEKQNILRINDILSELEKQLGPLERQSETAREYLKKKESLKVYDVNMFLLEREHVEAQQKQLKESLSVADGQLSEARAAYEQSKASYAQAEEALQELEEKVNAVREEAARSTLRKQQLEGQIEVLKEQINSVKANDEHYQNRLAAIAKDLEERDENRKALIQEKQELDLQLEGMTETENEASEELQRIQQKLQDLHINMENGKNAIIELLNARASTKGKLQRYVAMLEQIQIRKAELSQKLLKAKSDEAEQQLLADTYEEQLQTVCREIQELSEQKDACELQIEGIQRNLSTINEQLRTGQTAYHREASRLESLRNLTERYDGYGNSIRRVMECREKRQGILGVVADLMKVEKTYEVAIETALGGSIQNIVTDNEQTAKEMIQYLKANKYGRATFLPLTSIGNKNTFHQENALKEPGVIGLASRLVRTEPRFEGLMNYLLGRTLVVDQIDHAIALAKKFNYTLRIVTVEGESLSPGGSMTGGAFKNSSNLLGRRRELEELQENVRLLEKELQQATKAVEEAKAERNRLRLQVEEILNQLQDKYIIQNTARMNVDQAQQKIQESMVDYGSLQSEVQEMEHQIQEIKESQKQIQMELADSEAKEKANEIAILAYQREQKAVQEQEEAKSREAEQIHIAASGLEQKVTFVHSNMQRLDSETARLHEEEQEIGESRKAAALELEEKEKRILQIREEIQSMADNGSSLTEQIQRLSEEKEARAAEQKSFFEKREALSEQMTALDKEVFRLNSQEEKLEELLENQMHYMWEEYELTYNAALPLRDPAYENLADLKKRIAGVKEEIRRLGDVNVNAIEDFKQVSERYTFMNNQRNDLVTAEETLKQIIQELDTGMRTQFKEQFELIRIEFDKAFKELFGGGKGTLELNEGEDILETGVRIISQPPGKKLQNMMQLSGGEKALTAIALLFAIQNLKPSPFCLLDEIEAALDDSNVGRFAKYLHKLTKHTQFIIITHRRGTMTSADRLYGITMQEKGVSTLVSVNLIEADEMIQ